MSELLLEEQLLHHLKTADGSAPLWHVLNQITANTPHLKTRTDRRAYRLHLLQAYKSLRNKGKIVYTRRSKRVSIRA